MERYFETNRLILKPVTAADAQAMFLWTSDPEVNHYMLYKRHETIEDTYAWIHFLEEHPELNEFGFYLKADGTLIGAGGISPTKAGTYELGYNMNRAYWGKGYGTEAARGLLQWASRQLGAKIFSVSHAKENIRSQRVIEKCGFQYVSDFEFKKSNGSEVFPAKRYILEIK